MATRTKHMERSHRSYKKNKANLQGFQKISFAKSNQKKMAKENKSLFSKMFGNLRKSKGDK